MELFYLPLMSGHHAEPVAQRGMTTRGESLKLPDLAVQKPRDRQIGIVAEHSPRCLCFNYTFHTGVLHIMLFIIYIYIP